MKLTHIASLLSIMILMTWGCSENTPKETETKGSQEVIKTEPVQSIEKKEVAPVKVEKAVEVDASGAVNASGEPDAFGRKPGDEHYGHSHAPQGAPNTSPKITPNGAAAPTGGPDAFGRQPGDEHYGHSHE